MQLHYYIFCLGSKGVANANCPLAEINDLLQRDSISHYTKIPFWIMFIGAAGISIGLLLFDAKFIKAVSQEITELEKMRAFAMTLTAAITVISPSRNKGYQ